jgi:hypothetical protein
LTVDPCSTLTVDHPVVLPLTPKEYEQQGGAKVWPSSPVSCQLSGLAR